MGKVLIIKGADFSQNALIEGGGGEEGIIYTYKNIAWTNNSQFISDSSNNFYGKLYTDSSIADRSATNLSAVIDVEDFTHVKTTVIKRQGAAAAGGLVFLNSNKQPIEGILYKGEQNDGYKILDMDLPIGTKYIGTTAWTEPNNLGYGDFYLHLT